MAVVGEAKVHLTVDTSDFREKMDAVRDAVDGVTDALGRLQTACDEASTMTLRIEMGQEDES